MRTRSYQICNFNSYIILGYIWATRRFKQNKHKRRIDQLKNELAADRRWYGPFGGQILEKGFISGFQSDADPVCCPNDVELH
jgi:hypothetical protein